MSKPSEAAIFIESSIQIARLLAEKAQATAIEQTLITSDAPIITSDYVWMEYQRALIADFAHVHQAFQRARTMREAMRLVVSGCRRFRPRSLTRCGQIAGLACGEREVVRLADIRSLLALYLQVLLARDFWRYVTPMPDPIACDLTAAGVQREPDGTYTVADTCRKEAATCQLPDFLADRQRELGTIADHLSAHSHAIKDQARVERLLATVLADPRAALGQAACWPLGDVIIALQVPSDAAMWTLDADFKPLAEALGLRLYHPAVAL
jgi:hypothetical protein